MLALHLRFFEICCQCHLVIPLPKPKCFPKSIKWGGISIDWDGYRYDPTNFEALKNTVQPTIAAKLCPFVHAACVMDSQIAQTNYHCEWSIGKVIRCSWKPEKELCKKNTYIGSGMVWLALVGVSISQIIVMYRFRIIPLRPKKNICVHTDASNKFWSGVLTQWDSSKLQKQKMKQTHQLLSFLGSQFSPSQERWTTYEQEACAINGTFKRRRYMMVCEKGIDIFTGHKN